MSRMIGLVEGDGGLGPLQVMGCHRSDHVYFAIDDLQSTLTFDISENHQSGIDLGVFFTAIFPVFSFVRPFLFVLGLLPLELLHQESTLSSGMLRVNEISLFIFPRVNVTW